MALTAAYLDTVAAPNGTRPTLCVLAPESIQSTQFPLIFKEPDTGVLDVNGSQERAPIFIDGIRKGSIRQAFVLSIGEHTWKTMKCEERVQIAANETKRVDCKKQ